MAKPSSERLSRGTVINNRYEVLRFIGEGGQKRVYLVKDLNLEIHKDIVLKEMKKGDSEEAYIVAMQLFEQECILLMRLSHRVLPKIYDFFIDQGTFYIIQEFIEGEQLDVHLSKGYLSEETALEYILQLARFLNFLHTRRPPIIFRDLKPANVIVGKDSHLYIVDMSGALLPGIGSQAERVVVKTVGYFPPDARGSAASPDNDVYSLGVVLYEVLTRYAVARTPGVFPPVSEFRDEVPPEVENLLNRMILFGREFRIRSAWEAELEIEEALRSLRRYKKTTENTRGIFSSLYVFFHRAYVKHVKTVAPLLLLLLIVGIPIIPRISRFISHEHPSISGFPSYISYYFCGYALCMYFIWVRAFGHVGFWGRLYKFFHRRIKILGNYRLITLLVILNFFIVLVLYGIMIFEAVSSLL